MVAEKDMSGLDGGWGGGVVEGGARRGLGWRRWGFLEEVGGGEVERGRFVVG